MKRLDDDESWSDMARRLSPSRPRADVLAPTPERDRRSHALAPGGTVRVSRWARFVAWLRRLVRRG